MKIKFFVIFFLIILNFWVIFYFFILTKEKYNQVSILDVGQGSGTLIQLSDKKNILIDTGESSISLKSLTKSLGFFDKNLDLILVTHYDRDHVGLLPFLMTNYNIGWFFDTGIEKVEKSQEILFNEINKKYLEKNILKKKVLAGDFIFLNKDSKIKIFFPEKNFDLEKFKANNTSMVLQIIIEDKKFLITGDLEARFEKYLVKKYGDELKSDVLVVGHHGSKTSSSEIFLKKVSPKYFVISSGKNNPYKHPTKEVLERAQKLNFKILRTDILGNINFKIKNNLLIQE